VGQSHPSGEVSRGLIPAGFRNQGFDRRYGYGANPGDRCQSMHALIALRFRNDCALKHADLNGQSVDLIYNSGRANLAAVGSRVAVGA